MVDNNRSMCRICLFECNKKLSLFEDLSGTRYSDLIKEYTGIDLVRKDNLPTGLCKDCEVEIKTVIKFISKVRLASEKLNELIVWNVPVIFSSSIKYEKDDDEYTSAVSELIPDKDDFSNTKMCPTNKVYVAFPSDDDSEAEISLYDLKNKKRSPKTANKRNDLKRLKRARIVKNNKLEPENIPVKAESNSNPENDADFHDYCSDRNDDISESEHDVTFPNHRNKTFAKTRKKWKTTPLNNDATTDVLPKSDQEDTVDVTLSSKKKVDIAKNDNNLDSKYVILKKSEHCLMKDMIKCLTCGILSLNKSAFIVHYRKHTGEKPHKCGHCKMRYSQVGTLNAHIRKRHPKEWHKMKVLAKKLKEMREREFLEKCTAEPEAKNEEPDENGKKKLIKRRVICDICGKSYYHKYALNLHMRVHNVDDQIQCQYCPQRFVRTGDRILHVRVHHTFEKPYCCHMCGKAFASGTNLKKHLVVHSEERKFKCEVCDKGMKSKDNLKRHMLVMHDGTKSKVCHICGKRFALQYRLNVHMKNCHENKHSAVCDICKKSFRNIEKHMRRHTGDKPYKCTMCHKTFFQEKHLLGHLKKHQNESATFKCTYENCASAFSKKCVLEYHVLKYHLKHTPHVCQYCNRGFYRTKDLGKHMKSTHNVKLEFSITNDFSSN